ncbi:pyrroloquinoline quinone biosynthesis protein PqqE [Pelagibius marinus]|uniref:pyrroloquinoline quinone biosynthesis protein PqqE n=1 Tax=Pelagibius marinus TaxID=2762760 RepID=UPI001872D104|nr:pyrroloquinoline quinone biosynthesis protein PqqE [Pelagibius marinus]
MTELNFPLAILAELTHRCPLQCPYCSNPLALEASSAELSTGQWKAVIKEAAELGVLQIHFSGGEPTARRDLEDLVAASAAEGLYTNLITAGVLLSKERLAALAEAGLDHLQLSFQDSEAAGCDRIGNYKGGFEKKLDCARWVKEIGLPLTLNMVVHRQNLEHLEEMLALAEKLEAQRVEIAHVQYYGWAYLNRASLMPTRAQLERATEIVEAARARLKGVMVIDYVVPDYYARRPKSCMGGWGRQFLNISPAGKVLPCHAAESITSLTFDRVTDRSLRDIWENSEAFKAYRGTDWMPEPCRSCERKEIDWGGCRCQAFALTGEAGNVDPACGKSPVHEAMQALATAESAKDETAFHYRTRKAGEAAAEKVPEPLA